MDEAYQEDLAILAAEKGSAAYQLRELSHALHDLRDSLVNSLSPAVTAYARILLHALGVPNVLAGEVEPNVLSQQVAPNVLWEQGTPNVLREEPR